MFDDTSSIVTRRTRRVLDRPRHAGVLVAIIDDGGPLRVLLTRRTEQLKSHSGQVAFPGGSAEPGDADIIQTALREAHEEVGLPPEAVDVWGILDDFPTIRDDMAVTPVVGRVTALPELIPQPSEVARIFTIPMAALTQAEGWEIKTMPHRRKDWPVYFFEYDDETLWGLSAYITLHVLSLSSVGAPFNLPWNDVGLPD
ncbi:MAG: NUDIX hydrolase [Bradymonadia bacterium]